MKYLTILSYVVILSMFFLSMFFLLMCDKPNQRIAESDAYYKKLDTNYKIEAMRTTLTGDGSAHLGGPDMSNAKVGDIINGTIIGYHLGSPIVTGNNNVGIYQGPVQNRSITDPSEKKHISTSFAVNHVHQAEGGFGPSPLPFKTKSRLICMGYENGGENIAIGMSHAMDKTTGGGMRKHDSVHILPWEDTVPFSQPKAYFNNSYNFYIGMGAGSGIERGSFNIIVKEYGLSQVADTSFAFMVDYNSPMIKNHSMLKQYLYQVDLLFQDNPDLRKDTLFQIAIHKQLNEMFNFR